MVIIERWDVERDGALTEAAVRTRLQGKGYRVSRYDYPPGTVFPDHAHAVDKIDAVLSGVFEIVMAGQTCRLHAGEWVEVPAGIVHRAAVIGNETVVSLDAVRNSCE